MISSVIFDLDGTLTMVPSPWRYVHERLGVWENTAYHFLNEWLAGRVSYEEFCRRDTSLWNGRTVDEIHAFLDEIDLNRHVPAVVERLVARRIPSIIISSGFKYVAAKIQEQCGWNPLLIYANELVDGPAVGINVRINVSGDFAGPLSKKALAGHAVKSIGSTFSETLVVSDTTRDLEQLCDCGYKLHVQEEDDLLRVNDFL
ncbi:MAG TPA: HAD-IB family phosphatase [Terriglobia bacterium]|nr:HAD-IB family phosphatase [Terriglobia bacterium]